MYYYIFEPALEAKEYERVAHIKEYIAALGIAGEMTNPTPGRLIEDLVELAVAKRYSTVVAVGNIEHINRVARALEPYDIVFGILPFHENSDITELIGLSDWKSAADHLKKRRWQSVKLGVINNSLCFLTPAQLNFDSNIPYALSTPNYHISGIGGILTISPGRGQKEDGSELKIEIVKKEEIKSGIFSLFKKNKPFFESSQFVVSTITISTDEPIPVHVAGSQLTITPLTCSTQTKAIKLIMAKGITLG